MKYNTGLKQVKPCNAYLQGKENNLINRADMSNMPNMHVVKGNNSDNRNEKMKNK